jgi:hypothetical protein
MLPAGAPSSEAPSAQFALLSHRAFIRTWCKWPPGHVSHPPDSLRPAARILATQLYRGFDLVPSDKQGMAPTAVAVTLPPDAMGRGPEEGGAVLRRCPQGCARTAPPRVRDLNNSVKRSNSSAVFPRPPTRAPALMKTRAPRATRVAFKAASFWPLNKAPLRGGGRLTPEYARLGSTSLSVQQPMRPPGPEIVHCPASSARSGAVSREEEMNGGR